MDTMSPWEDTFDAATKAAKLQFDEGLAVSPVISFVSSTKDICEIISKAGQIGEGVPPTPVMTAKAQGTKVQINWSCATKWNEVTEVSIQFAMCSDEKQEGERDWQDSKGSLSIEENKFSMLLKHETHYVLRMRVKNKTGWSHYCDPVHVTTGLKRWTFVGFGTWKQDASKQSDKDQDQLMNTAAQSAFPGSVAASGVMYHCGRILNMPKEWQTIMLLLQLQAM
eukprot:TRINITY_DN2083_c0_g1_i1.p1 TRINITY_DN2083_c0_g1~~TRINITY_DN2083_c0_g1_i1.p1  ORF type:complete len:224 (-),score=35.64 TRINITY_DN2083_c0_g1_i1:245-916(-)